MIEFMYRFKSIEAKFKLTFLVGGLENELTHSKKESEHL
jgi:hypothetical protein